jgi:hypothetical protein
MDDWKALQTLDYMKRFDNCSYGTTLLAINRSIDALYFEMRARELFNAVIDLLVKQRESDVVLNLLEETVHYDDAECDGYCLMEDICHLLVDGT